MFLLTSSGIDSFFQLVTVLIIFAVVLLMCYITTRWIANYQKGMNFSRNIEFIESHRVTANKFLQIVKVGDTVNLDEVGIIAENGVYNTV